MKNLYFLLPLAFISFVSFSQAPRIQWQRCLGGSLNEGTGNKSSLAVTSDSGYIVGGYSVSNDGDASVNKGGEDFWLIRMDQQGRTLWTKSFGGSSFDFLKAVKETPDSGFIVVGTVYSNDGDVSGNHGGTDIWVVKLTQNGSISWQKCLGGFYDEEGYDVALTQDGGYLVAGVAGSNNGDVSGFHGEVLMSTDAWIVKLDSTGEKVWQKCLGGTNSDKAVSINRTNDGGFIIGAETSSNDGDVSGYRGSGDIWLLKMNLEGDILWKRCYGGFASDAVGTVEQTPDGGYMIVGNTMSYDGDVSGNHGRVDGWAAKTDSTGNIIWQKCYGGPGFQWLNGVVQLPNNEFIFSGIHSGSPGGEVTGEHGTSIDAWIVRVSSTGSIAWQQCYGGLSSDNAASIVESPDGGFLFIGHTRSKDFDVRGLHVPTVGWSDIWVVKLDISNIITGVVYLDRNLNGSKETNESLVTGGIVKSIKNGQEQSTFVSNGLFINPVDTGSYNTTIDFSPYYTVVPVSKASAFATYLNKDSFSFALQPIPGKRDLGVVVVPLNVARPGFNLSCRIYYKNNGTDTIANGEILFKKDSRLSFLSAIPGQSSINGDTLKWSFNNLKPLDTASVLINFRVQAPPAVSINDTLKSLAIITPVMGDLTPADDTAYLNQRAQGSYDPNDKTENLAGKISQREVSGNSYINYLIRFQNTGTDTAFTVTVRDTLDAKLDWSSLQMVAASNAYQLNIKSENQLTWSFNNIMLVDSNRNEPASHGFIAYRIKPKNSLVIGDIIKNTAAIYFDYNLPVETNTQETEVVQYSIVNPQVGIPTISSFSPIAAATAATVTIAGTNLTGATAVTFGGIAATSFTVNSATSITAVVGTGASGSVSVTTAGGTATLAGFTFIATPTITSFTPTSAATAATVTITGTNLTGATAVSFGGIAATSFTVNSATSITAVVGTGASGSVSVTTAGGTATLAGFTFIATPTITSFTPTSAATAATVTITGTNLTGATAVTFGGIAATSFTVNSATSITAVVGTGTSGSVSVTTAGGTATLAGFTFIATPTITSFTPTSAATAATVTITGTNLTGATAVSFGGIAATSFTVNSSTSITAVVGTGATGSVSVTTPGGTTTLPGFTFTVITAIDPDPANSLGIRLYPNPTTGSFVIDTLKLSDKWETLEIFNADGKKKLARFTIKNQTRVELNVGYLSHGLYMAILKRKNGSPAVIKFIKL